MARSGENDLLALAALGFFAGLYFFIRGFSCLKKKRLIENMPTSKIRSVAMGLVEVCGSVLPFQKRTLKSPFSNRDCVYYKYKIEEYRHQGKSRKWVTVSKGDRSLPFYVRDDTGTVLVDPAGAKVEVQKDHEFSSGMGQDPPLLVMEFLKNKGLSFEGFLGVNKKMRYIEHFIEPGDILYVMGCADDNPFIEEGSSEEGVKDVMIQKSKGQPYYISDRREKDIIKELNIQFLFGVLGALLSIASLAFFLVRTGML